MILSIFYFFIVFYFSYRSYYPHQTVSNIRIVAVTAHAVKWSDNYSLP